MRQLQDRPANDAVGVPAACGMARTDGCPRRGQVRERAELAIFSGREVVVVDQIGSPARLRGVTELGKSVSLHGSCIGKALLAQLPDGLVLEVLSPRLTRFTESTVTDHRALLAERRRARRKARPAITLPGRRPRRPSSQPQVPTKRWPMWRGR